MDGPSPSQATGAGSIARSLLDAMDGPNRPSTATDGTARAVADDRGADQPEPDSAAPGAGVFHDIVFGSSGGLVAIAAVLLAAGFGVHLGDGPTWLRLTLLGLSAILASTRTFSDAITALRALELDVDVLMFVAAAGASILGHYEEGVLLLVLFGAGSAGEEVALARAHKAIDALRSVAPDIARRIDADGTETIIDASEVRPEDRLLVLPFERLPADGTVERGTSLVDQATITGESMPVERGPGDDVFAGTLNGDQRLLLIARRAGADTTLGRVIQMVEAAQTEKSSTQVLTERIERWYVPLIFVLTIVFCIVPPWLSGGGAETWSTWFYRSMAFLTAASPCALAIGSPAAVLCGVARAARSGVLIKGGGPLETLGRLDVLCVDKTGTLTVGRPELHAVVLLERAEDVDEAAVLRAAAAIEAQTTHPLADAITEGATARGVTWPDAADVRQETGQGVRGVVDGMTVTVGRLAADVAERAGDDVRAALQTLESAGSTLVAVHMDDRPVAVLALADRVRPESAEVVAAVRALGVRDVVMLTGDRRAVAESIAAQVGIERVAADLMPEEKLATIEHESAGGITAMMGDGVNDAPALARAHIGIAVGAVGADVAMETADVVLVGSTIERLPEALSISRAARRIVRQNLLIALSVIGIVAPAALFGIANLPVAVVLHEGSTVVVVLNALRLLRVGGHRLSSVATPEASQSSGSP